MKVKILEVHRLGIQLKFEDNESIKTMFLPNGYIAELDQVDTSETKVKLLSHNVYFDVYMLTKRLALLNY